MKRNPLAAAWLVVLIGMAAGPGGRTGSAASLKDSIGIIRSVKAEGQGNLDAAQALQHLSQSKAEALPEILAGMDGANELAVNWLRSAAEGIADRELGAGGSLPLSGLGAFLLDTRHHPRARRMAFELIQRVEPEAASSLVPGMVNDPSLELRHDAVQRLIDRADGFTSGADTNAATLVYLQALGFARDIKQIQHVNDRLKKAGEKVDLPALFGFLMDWHVIGPFHNTNKTGFDEVFPPEQGVNLAAESQGKLGPVRWTPSLTRHDYGMVDINPVCGSLKEVTAYAYTEFGSLTARPAELRLGCKNGWKIWFNGKLLFGRDEYHRNMEIDQYIMPIELKPGSNTILVKICQNEQVEEWTKEWEFQLRVCDAVGTAIASVNLPSNPRNLRSIQVP